MHNATAQSNFGITIFTNSTTSNGLPRKVWWTATENNRTTRKQSKTTARKIYTM